MNNKLPQEFRSYKEFISEMNEELSNIRIDLSDLTIDHIAYQASSTDEYERLIRKCKQNGRIESESLVGGRRVGIARLYENLEFEEQEFSIIEIVEPKKGQKTEGRLEHVEYTFTGTLEELVERYPDIDWDT